MQNIELEDLKSLTNSDLSEVYDLNQSLTPKLGSLLNTLHLERLIEMSDCSKAIKINGKVAAFMICFRENTAYESRNYHYFNEKHDQFLYVDRIGVLKGLENNGLGTILYKYIIENFGKNLKLCAEINIKPMNKTSILFHEKHDFERVSEKLLNENYKVVYMERNAS